MVGEHNNGVGWVKGFETSASKKAFAGYLIFIALLVLTATLLVQFAAAQGGGLGDYPELTLTVQDNAIGGPDSLEAGYYRLAVNNESGLEPDISIARLEDGTTVEEALAAVETVNMSFMGQAHPGEAMAQVDSLLELIGGQSMPPGATFELTPGEYLIVSVGANEAGQSHIDMGLHKTLTVTESANQPEPPQADVTVRMVDFAFALPPDIRPGVQTWEVVNVGDQIHHMVLLRVKEGKTMEDVMAFMQSQGDGPPQGEPPADEVGYINVLSTDESNYLTFDLTLGDYIAICFMPDYETGQPHVALGMMQAFTVAGE